MGIGTRVRILDGQPDAGREGYVVGIQYPLPDFVGDDQPAFFTFLSLDGQEPEYLVINPKYVEAIPPGDAE
jgi:hypothetical protein